MPVGGEEYRRGAKERLDESRALLKLEKFAGSVYLAGRAVESALRALIWLHDSDYSSGKKILKQATICEICSQPLKVWAP